MAISSTSSAVALSLLSYYNGSSSSASEVLSSLNSTSTASTVKTVAKMTPWDASAPKTETEKLASKTLNSSSLFAGGLGSGAGSGVTSKNDRELFLLYNAVDKLRSLAETASTKTMSASLREKIQARIDRGIEEIKTQAEKVGLDGATLVAGKKYSSQKSETIGSKATTTYQTAALVTGDENTIPSQFQGDVKFTISAKTETGSQTINIDLSGMGSTSRTVGNVASYINEQLEAAGIESRVGRVETTRTSTYSDKVKFTEQRLQVSVASGESISFGGVAGDTETAVYVAGVATTDKVGQGLLTKFDVSDSGETEKVSETNLTASNGANIRAMTRDQDGNVYLIANVSGTFNDKAVKDTTDVVLQKLDSAGKVVWSRNLGSAEAASGFSIAVSNDGTIAIAGSVDGLGDAQKTTKGTGIDSFVATFTDEGKDLWYHQKGSSGTDYATDIAFDDDGNLFVLGQTNRIYGGADIYGKNDVYVQSFDINGNVNYTKSMGTSGNDAAVGIEISGNQVLVGWNTETEGHISRLDGETGDFAAADYMTSTNGINKLSAFDLDNNGNVIVAGNAVADGPYNQIKGINLLTQATTFSADVGDNSVRSLDVGSETVNIALEGVLMENAANTKALQTTIKGYSLTDSTEKYSFNVLGEADKNVSIVTAESQSKSLQALGFPQGELTFDNTKSLTDLTGLRVGDHFFISVNGGIDRKITIAKDETMQSLVAKVKKYAGRGANVTLGTTTKSTTSKDDTTDASTVDGAKYMNITPKTGYKVELKAGSGSFDALAQLGLNEGVLLSTTSTSSSSKSKNVSSQPVVALELPNSVDVSTAASAKEAMTALTSVLTRIRTGYRAVSTDPTMVELRKQSSSSSSSSSAAVAAYNAKAAEYANALAKLTA